MTTCIKIVDATLNLIDSLITQDSDELPDVFIC